MTRLQGLVTLVKWHSAMVTHNEGVNGYYTAFFLYYNITDKQVFLLENITF